MRIISKMFKVGSSKAVKQIQFPTKTIESSVDVGFESTEVVAFFGEYYTDINNVFIANGDLKPRVVSSIIDQITLFAHLGEEVSGWSVHYFAPAKIEKNEYEPSRIAIERPPLGVIQRWIVSSHDEVALLIMKKGGSEATKKIFLKASKAYLLCFEIGMAVEIVVRNVKKESIVLNPRGGVPRPVEKKPAKRCFLVFDAHPDIKVAGKTFSEDLKSKIGVDLGQFINESSNASGSNDPIPFPE
jgi:hypothetical protein